MEHLKRAAKFLAVLIFVLAAAVAIDFYQVARTDLDYMVNQYKWSKWHREQDVWWFSTEYSEPWWDAYIHTVIKLDISLLVLGFELGAGLLWVYFNHLRRKP